MSTRRMLSPEPLRILRIDADCVTRWLMSKRLSRFDELERAVIRAAQVSNAFQKAAMAAKEGTAPTWNMNDERVSVLLKLADGLMDYLEWPHSRWGQGHGGELDFFVVGDQLRMKFDVTIAGFELRGSSIGVYRSSQATWNAFTDQHMSVVNFDRPEMLTEFYEQAADWIKHEAIKVALGQPR